MAVGAFAVSANVATLNLLMAAGGPPSTAPQSQDYKGVRGPFRPAAILRLSIRLDDGTNQDGKNAVDEGKPDQVLTTRLARTVDTMRSDHAYRAVVNDVDLEADIALARAEKDLASAKKTPNKRSASAAPNNARPDAYAVKILIVPHDLTVELNGFRQADKVQATFSMLDLPLHPSIIRSMMVEVFMGTVAAEDFGDPSRWAPQISQSTIMFRGYADVANMDVGDEEYKVQIDATSLEQRLMVKKINPLSKSRRVNGPSEDLTEYLKRLISTVPEFSGALGDQIDVKLYPGFNPDKAPKLGRKLLNMTLQSAASRNQAAGGQVGPNPVAAGTEPGDAQGAGATSVPGPVNSPGTEITVWDIFTRAAELCGLIPIYDPAVDPNAILLAPPQNLKEGRADAQGRLNVEVAGLKTDNFYREFSDGFGGTIRSFARLFVWGRNVSTMKTSRKFGRITAPAVRVVSYNPDAAPDKRVLSYTFPTKLQGTKASAPGTGGKDGGAGHPPIREVVTRTIQGVRDIGYIRRAAVALWSAISRQELTVKIETDDMASFVDPLQGTNPNSNPDLLKLRPGTPVQVNVAEGTESGFITTDLNRLFESRHAPAFLRQQLEKQSGFMGLAITSETRAAIDEAYKRIEKAYQEARITDWFYCRGINHKFNIEKGYGAELEVANFVEARFMDLSPEDQAELRAQRAEGAHPPAATDWGAAKNFEDLAAKESAYSVSPGVRTTGP